MRLILVALAACSGAAHRGPDEPPPPREAGITISVYAAGDQTYGVVDDRRWVTVEHGTITLDRIEPGASLASLVIEPLPVASCVRERIDPSPEALHSLALAATVTPDDDDDETPPKTAPPPIRAGVLSPLVRCRVQAPPGRHLVRVLYVARTLRYHTTHRLDLAGGKATLATRYAIATPPWATDGELRLHEGLPGGDTPVRELVRGKVRLDGSSAILAPPPRDVTATVRTVYDGAVVDTDTPWTELAWGAGSQPIVWTWAELPGVGKLADGPIQIRATAFGDTRDTQIAASMTERRGDTLRVPLWAEATLRGTRTREVLTSSNGRIVERLRLSVANLGDAPRTVTVEERLRPGRRRTLSRTTPPTLAPSGGRVSQELALPARGSAEVAFSVAYDL